MRNASLAISILVLAALGACCAAAGGLLKNADFTARAEGDQLLPAAWTIDAAYRSLYTDTNEDGHSGQDSLGYAAKEAVPGGPVTQTCDCQKNTEYVLTAALKSDGVCKPLVRVYARDIDQAVVSLVSEGEKVWKVYSTRFNSGGATKLEVQLFGDQEIPQSGKATTGTSGIDDVQIYLASEAPAEV